jgi:3-oxoacyl-[acyl-carrier-protein] synthase III
MFSSRFKSVCIESIGLNLPTNEVSSAQIEERIAPLYQKLEIPFGTLERISGIKSRFFFDDSVLPSEAGTLAAERALQQSHIKPSEIGAIFSCSVCRDCFEPATAALIHGKLGLREDSLAFDISNACVGFSNGLMTAAHLIETGVIKAALVVSAETVSRMIDASLKQVLAAPNLDRETLLKFLPTVTLGAGAVSYLLCHESISKAKHKYVGGIVRSATQFSDLCVGNGDFCFTQGEDFTPFMTTDSQKLITSAAVVGGRAWQDLSQLLEWSPEQVNHVICHQVGKQVNEAFYRTVGLDRAKEFTIYQKYGNLVSAAVPTALALAIEGRGFKQGDKVVLMGYGSGVNAAFSGIIW